MSEAVNGLLAQAKRAAQRRNQRLGTAHVVLAMLQSGGRAGNVLTKRGLRETDLLCALKVMEEEPESALEIAIERADKLAVGLGAGRAHPLHFLLAVSRDTRSSAYRCLEAVGLGATRVRDDVLSALGVRATAAPELPKRTLSPVSMLAPQRLPTPLRTDRSEDKGREEEPRYAARPSRPRLAPLPRPARNAKRKKPRIDEGPPAEVPSDRYALDRATFPKLTQLGRNLSHEAVLGVLEPLIGRERELDELLDVLARRRANNPILVGPSGVGKTAIVHGLARHLVEAGDPRILIELGAGALVSGTGVRGALADRMRAIREEVAKADGRVVLFIDEIHAVASSGEGADDLAAELRSALARGELACIGATTDDDYRRYIERDATLSRRFSVLHVAEPSEESAREIVEGVAPRYEAHHGLGFSPCALDAAVELSARYITDKTLPDKAIGVLDLAAARAKRRSEKTVDRAAVADVVSKIARVPVERLLLTDAERLIALESLLEERIVGQKPAIARIADALRKGAAGFRGKRPLGTFLLLGPTGVGKTEMAKAVADLVFPTGAMTRVDMSELSESHAVARLVGAPPGYLGHDAGGQLTEAVRRRPYQLLLLDEIEKAHPEVLLALLPLLDEGRMTDGRGRTVDFSHTVVFMTSNLGASASSRGRIGFSEKGGAEESPVIAEVRRALPPELFNRIDEPLVFTPLRESEVHEIAARMLVAVARTLFVERGIVLEWDDALIAHLVRHGGFDPSLGARPMRRTVARLVESRLADEILSGRVGRADSLVIRVEDGALRVEKRT